MAPFDSAGKTYVSLPLLTGMTLAENLLPLHKNFRPKVVSYSRPETLASETISTLKAFFDANDNHPSDQMWIALRALASRLEAMAEERCEPQLFLSSLDPGVALV
jgi:hypothetical protein